MLWKTCVTIRCNKAVLPPLDNPSRHAAERVLGVCIDGHFEFRVGVEGLGSFQSDLESENDGVEFGS